MKPIALFQRLTKVTLSSLTVGSLLLFASGSCSVLLKEDATQCKTDGDCSALGLADAVCDVSAGVCLRKDHASGGASGADNGGSSGAAPLAGSGGLGGAANVSGGTSGAADASEAGQAGESAAGAAPTCEGDCFDPVGVRLVESAALPAYQPPGTLLGVEQFHTDVCPQDQVLIGFDLTFGSDASSNKFLLDAQAHCAIPSLGVTTPRELVLDEGEILQKRGSESDLIATTLVECLPGEIAVGWSGIVDSTHIEKFVLRCAKPAVKVNQGISTLSLAAAADVVPFVGYDSAATPLAAQDCPPGFVARGSSIRLSNALAQPQRLERFGLVCGRPSLVLKTGAPCQSDGDCDSGACADHYCAAPTCNPGLDCKCERLDTRDYEICTDAVQFSQAGGALGCASQGMRLVKIDDGIENGWLFSTGRLLLPPANNNSGMWIGATDSAQEGQWRWLDKAQTLFWQGMNVDQGGMAVGKAFSAWKRVGASEEPNNGHGAGNPAENCGFIDINGFDGDDRWVDAKCVDLRPYACEFEDGR